MKQNPEHRAKAEDLIRTPFFRQYADFILKHWKLLSELLKKPLKEGWEDAWKKYPDLELFLEKKKVQDMTSEQMFA